MVYVVQRHTKRGPSGGRVDKFDLSAAQKFGEFVYLSEDNADPTSSDVAREMDKGLQGFCDNDYLLLIGNPALIGLAFAIASEYNNGSVNVLQWSGQDSDYKSLNIKF